MEEADLLRERLQAITDKRRVQEDIAKKRRQIEEEKLKLQYLKKKSLREQWLMDGLSPQSEEEQDATKLQAEDDQQKTVLLQSNINMMEKEIDVLESQELNISANEEVILKRLKEVERTAEDIIKELNADFQPEPIQYLYSPIPDMLKSYQPKPLKKITSPKHEPDCDEPKKATFAMEISVERDMRTGESQVVSTATITPQEFEEKGVKVYDDGRKSVYALHSDSQVARNGVGELSPLELEELLRQASDKKVPTDVQYHQPVYAAPYAGSRPSTPRKTEREQLSPWANGHQTPSKTPSPFQPEALLARQGAQSRGEETHQSLQNIPNPQADKHLLLQHQSPSHQGVRIRQGSLSNGGGTYPDTNRLGPAMVLVQRSGDIPSPIPLTETTVQECRRQSPLYFDSESTLNIIDTLPSDLDSKPVTMIFMGYQNAEEEEDEEDIQAELVVISNDEDEDEDNNGEPCLSFHPEGYRSKIFQPDMSAQAKCNRDSTEARSHSDNLQPHRPTFSHKPGKHSPWLDRQTNRESMEDPTTAALKMSMAKLGGKV